MGNHTAGALIVGFAETMYDRRQEGETAKEILDAAVEKAKASSGFSTDAEFDDSFDPGTTFRKLLIEVFTPAGRNPDDYTSDEGGWELFYDEIHTAFSDEYGLS